MSKEWPEYVYGADEWPDEIADDPPDFSVTVELKDGNGFTLNPSYMWVDGELIWKRDSE